MKRREFIKKAMPISTVPIIIGGMPVSVIAESQNLNKLVNGSDQSDRVLVLIFLDGGNDGINTIMPLDQ